MFCSIHKATLKASLAASLLLSMGAAHATNWSSVNFDHENSRNNSSETVLTPSNVNQLTLLWATAPSAGGINVTPIVVNDVVYYGDTTGNLFAKNVEDGTDAYPSVNLGASIDGPVTVVGSTLYATDIDLNLYAFNLDLTPKLAFNGGSVVIDPSAVGKAQVYAGPVVADNIVIVPITSGQSEIYFTLYPSLRGGINAFNATTGQFLWRTPIIGLDEGTAGGAWSTPSVDTVLKRIFVGTTNATSPPAGDLTAALLSIDYQTGEIVWSNQYTKNAVWGLLYPCGNDFDLGASPNLFEIKHGGKMRPVVGAASKTGVYRVFDRKHGHEMWEAELIPNDGYISINGNPSAAVANGTVYAITNYDTSGLPINVINILVGAGNPGVQAEAIGELVLSFSQYDHTRITALDAKHGFTKWTNDLVGSTFASLTHANGVLYTGNFNGVFRALKASNGTELFSDSFGFPVSSPITVVDGKVFIATGVFPAGGTLRVYGLPSSR